MTAENLRDDERNWDDKLGKIQWGLNNTMQKTIGRSPAEVMFGSKMNSEKNSAMNEIVINTREDEDVDSIRVEVKDRIDKCQVAQKLYYDKGRRPARVYKNGELVKITKVAFHNNGKSTKLMPNYEGPYKVIKILGNDRYKVAPIAGFEGMRNKKKTTVASDRMKPWIHVASLEIEDVDEDDAPDDGDDAMSSD